MLWLGFVTGRLFGWTPMESAFAGAIIAISSTTIIAKAFDELGVRGKLRELVVGVLIVEDLIAILLMAMLTAVARGSGLSAAGLAVTVGQLLLARDVLALAGSGEAVAAARDLLATPRSGASGSARAITDHRGISS
jgi:CPA2 family monovalent cation:H+ antiporter-2